MNISKAGNIIRYLLKNNAAVNAIVGSKIRPNRAADSDNYPYIIYESISKPTTQTKDGNAQWYKMRFQLSMLATSLDSVQDLTDKVRIALDNQSGTIAGFTVQNITLEDERDIFNDNSAIDGVYMLQQDYFLIVQI